MRIHIGELVLAGSLWARSADVRQEIFDATRLCGNTENLGVVQTRTYDIEGTKIVWVVLSILYGSGLNINCLCP